jgi:hypothetical protein
MNGFFIRAHDSTVLVRRKSKIRRVTAFRVAPDPNPKAAEKG